MTLSLLSRLKKISHSINGFDKTSESVNSSIESQDFSIVKVPKVNDVVSTDISITESQFSSTMPYCEESLVAKLDPLGESQFLSAQPCHKEDTTFPHESANLVTEEGTSDDSTEDCSSGTSASKILPVCSLLDTGILVIPKSYVNCGDGFSRACGCFC